MVDLRAAYASCERDARAHYENFPVASLLIPRAMRRHVAAVYAFARAADDLADEGDRPASERCNLLERWGSRLRAAATGRSAALGVMPGEPATTDHIFAALAATIREKDLPVALFEDLLSAFRQDVSVTRYATWPDVMDYCRRSANPIGRLVLRIAGYNDARLDEWSDALCTALQLTNFWQDLGRDFNRGRIYLPAEELRAHGAREQDLQAESVTAEWRRALAAAASRTRIMFDAGKPICDAVHGRLRYELRATWLGGVRILTRLEHAGFDVIRDRPRLRSADAPWLVWRLARWSARS